MKNILLILLLMSCAASNRLNDQPVTVSVYSRALWDEWCERTGQVIADDKKKNIRLFYIRDNDTIAERTFRPR